MYKLYYTDASPYARTVRIWARELGISEHISEVFQHPFDNDPQHLQDNPLGKVPCLVHENGLGLFDSTLICEYLYDQHRHDAELSLYHDTFGKRLYYLSKGILDLAVARQQEKLREFQDDFWMERFDSGISRSLNELERHIAWLDTKDWCLTHIGVGSALDYLLFRHSDINWRKENSLLNEWFESSFSRQTIIQTQPT
jgi:glutathione S-transferase